MTAEAERALWNMTRRAKNVSAQYKPVRRRNHVSECVIDEIEVHEMTILSTLITTVAQRYRAGLGLTMYLLLTLSILNGPAVL
jgi:hypothetical protein